MRKSGHSSETEHEIGTLRIDVPMIGCECMSSDVFIIAALRSPIGRYNGKMAQVPAPDLAAPLIAALAPMLQSIDGRIEVMLGCALTGGLGQNPARQAMIHGGLPEHIPACTLGSVCGSGLDSVILGARSIMSGDADIVLAGGMESMSRAADMQHDGLRCALTGEHMGETAERLATECGITRVQQDTYALESHRRALQAQDEGWFTHEIVTRNELMFDEVPRRDTSAEKLAALKPVFSSEGTVTAGNASAIADGAAVLVLASGKMIAQQGIQPLARIVSSARIGMDPLRMGLGASAAALQCLKKAKLRAKDVDLWEINEAFASQTLAVLQTLAIDASRVNIHGGAIALGHPLGASGARVLVTLIHALERRDLKRGMASVCVGGGQGVSVFIER